MEKSNSKYFLVPLGMVIFIISCVCLMIFVLISIYGKPSKKSLIKKYKNNAEMFEKAKDELYDLKDNDIYISKEENNIYISIHIDNGDDIVIKNVEEEFYYQYEDTINIMNRLNLHEVKKEDQNIIFSMSKFGQEIVMMKNEKEYKWQRKIIEKEQLKNNWYYVQIDP